MSEDLDRKIDALHGPGAAAALDAAIADGSIFAGKPEPPDLDVVYPPMVQRAVGLPRPGWIKLISQDDAAAPGDFPMIRQVLGGSWPLTETELGYNLAITLWDKPPREYPPQHVGRTSAGQTLARAEVEALRDALTEWLEAHP